jgi:tetratricopeptide (TPR) repeat protein
MTGPALGESGGVTDEVVAQALARASDPTLPLDERISVLVEVAVGLQERPKAVSELFGALRLYERALELAGPTGDALLEARIRLGKASVLGTLPGESTEALEAARDELEQALPVVRAEGDDEEVGDAEMRLGLMLQTLVAAHRARMPDAIQAYHRALRVFTRETHPREFAILHNNLATAYLSLPLVDEHAKMREALAVSSFEEALRVVTLTDEPVEYAMLQNNLGNALQYMPSGHRLANVVRAIEAYDEALRVRTARDMPIEHANTIANKANALANLPDDLERPEAGNPSNLREAVALYRRAETLFAAHGLADRAGVVAEALAEIEAELPPAGPEDPAPADAGSGQVGAGAGPAAQSERHVDETATRTAGSDPRMPPDGGGEF